MDQVNNKELIKEIERLEAQVSELLKEKKELLREIERLTYSGD